MLPASLIIEKRRREGRVRHLGAKVAWTLMWKHPRHEASYVGHSIALTTPARREVFSPPMESKGYKLIYRGERVKRGGEVREQEAMTTSCSRDSQPTPTLFLHARTSPRSVVWEANNLAMNCGVSEVEKVTMTTVTPALTPRHSLARKTGQTKGVRV